MGEDDKKINKFLELLPDRIAESFFYYLNENMIEDEVLNIVRAYIEYIAKFGLVFESKILNSNHQNFFESLKILNRFILPTFFRKNPSDNVFVLHPDVRNNYPEQWNKFESESRSLSEDTENKYWAYRKSVEEYLLESREKGIVESLRGEEKIKLNKFPHTLLRGTTWEDFMIQFMDDKNVFIKIGKFEHTTNYKEMGFLGRGKNPEPSMAWVFLKVLATVGGELSMENPEAREKYKKQKELLSEKLEDYFTLEYDPFYPYDKLIKNVKKRNSYKIKITLISPPKEEKPKNTIEKEKDDPLGIKEYLGEQSSL